MNPRLTRWIVLGICLAATSAIPAAAGTVDFDSISASCCYSDVYPGTGRGPDLTFGNLWITGGVVMNNDGWNGTATTAPNLYGTSDTNLLADGSVLPGFITITFLTSISHIDLDLINGEAGADFTLTAYDSSLSLLGSSTISLNDWGSAGSIGHAGLDYNGISRVVITSGQQAGSIDFAIDTINFGSGTTAPEPGTWVSLGGGAVALLLFRRRKA